MKTYKYYCDPGHGWLAVKRTELERLQILQKVSSYSYQRGQTVYLEEDRDLQLFDQAKKLKGEEVRIDHKHTDKRSPIRSYDSFVRVGQNEGEQ